MTQPLHRLWTRFTGRPFRGDKALDGVSITIRSVDKLPSMDIAGLEPAASRLSDVGSTN